MFESVREGWTTLGLLKRLVVLLGRMAKAFEELSETQRLALKLSLLEHGASVEDLRAEEAPQPSDEGYVEDTQDDEDFAEMERVELAMKARGRAPEDDADLGEVKRKWENVEEKG